MSVRRVSTREARDLVESEDYTYVDVRTPEEYAAGHPRGALNVPAMLRVDDRMTDNGAFLTVMRGLFPLSAKLVLGCATGKRSLTAAERLLEAGYQNVVEMRAGYSGIRNAFGQVEEKGWAAAGHPTALTTTGGRYEDVKRRSGQSDDRAE